MHPSNRFAPPGALGDDVNAGSGYRPVRIWPPRGSIGRLRFLAYSLALYLLAVVLAAVLGLVSVFVGVRPELVAWASIAIYPGAGLLVPIQRSHDMNLSGWWSLLAFIPLVGLYWLLKGGTPGDNRWGAPPPPNGLGVRILAFVMVAFVAFGVIAGIVAGIAMPGLPR